MERQFGHLSNSMQKKQISSYPSQLVASSTNEKTPQSFASLYMKVEKKFFHLKSSKKF